MTVRTLVNLTLAVLTLTVVGSFAFGGFLILRGTTVVSVPPVAPSFDELLLEGDGHLTRQQIEQALLAYRRALAVAPRSVEAQIGVARGELLAGREQEASLEFERALTLDPSNREALKELGVIYSHGEATWVHAERIFRTYASLKPVDPIAQLWLARVMAWRGLAAEASALFAVPAVSAQMTVEDRTSHAFALIKSGQMRQAETAIRSLLSSGHRDPRLTLQLAHIYAAHRDWDAALPLYKELLMRDSGNADVNLSYGSGLLAIRRYRDALEPLRVATTKMPGNGAAGLAYARALKGANAKGQAVREFGRVLPMYASNASVIREYGDLLLEQRQYGKAEREYKRALAMGLDDVSLYVALSGALRGNRKPREALPYLQKAYALAPTERLAFELARLHQQLGQGRQAQALLDSIPTSARSRGSD